MSRTKRATASSPTSNFISIFDAAFKEYKKLTGQDLNAHGINDNVEKITSDVNGDVNELSEDTSVGGFERLTAKRLCEGRMQIILVVGKKGEELFYTNVPQEVHNSWRGPTRLLDRYAARDNEPDDLLNLALDLAGMAGSTTRDEGADKLEHRSYNINITTMSNSIIVTFSPLPSMLGPSLLTYRR
ncbi:hypothetical protein EDB86DRAFT_3080922 [Lactarius hatsudake]|nr:hypothetical protein EDB86DRAFT_3080922 [Lactarius hatsudake]